MFSTPSSILGSVGSVGASLMLWVLGFVLSFCGLFIWLELGTMFPRSGGEKVYLEAVYQRPKHLATFVFAANAIILGFSSSNCIVGLPTSRFLYICKMKLMCPLGFCEQVSAYRLVVVGISIVTLPYPSILVSANHEAGRWVTRGIAIAGDGSSAPSS